MKALEVNKFKAFGIIGDVKEAFLKAAELDPEHIDTAKYHHNEDLRSENLRASF